MSYKVTDWEPRFTDYINSVSKHVFRWGSHDCFTFVAGYIHYVTADRHNIGEHILGKYTTEDEGCLLLTSMGHTYQSLIYRRLHRYDIVTPNIAQRGDVALIQAREFQCGVALAIKSAVDFYAMTSRGVRNIKIPENKIISCWRL